MRGPPRGGEATFRGWGGRDRTYAYRVQSAVPYHLATPQNHAHTLNDVFRPIRYSFSDIFL